MEEVCGGVEREKRVWGGGEEDGVGAERGG